MPQQWTAFWQKLWLQYTKIIVMNGNVWEQSFLNTHAHPGAKSFPSNSFLHRQPIIVQTPRHFWQKRCDHRNDGTDRNIAVSHQNREHLGDWYHLQRFLVHNKVVLSNCFWFLDFFTMFLVLGELNRAVLAYNWSEQYSLVMHTLLARSGGRSLQLRSTSRVDVRDWKQRWHLHFLQKARYNLVFQKMNIISHALQQGNHIFHFANGFESQLQNMAYTLHAKHGRGKKRIWEIVVH